MAKRRGERHWYDEATGAVGLLSAVIVWLCSAPSQDILFNDVATDAGATGSALGCVVFAVASALVLMRCWRRPVGQVRRWSAIFMLAASFCLMLYTAFKALGLKTRGDGGSIWATSGWTLGVAFSVVLIVGGLLPLLRRRR